MRVVLQRVKYARVEVVRGALDAAVQVSEKTNEADLDLVGSIEDGLMLLVGFGAQDTSDVLKPMMEKLINMRIFADEQKKFNLSLMQVGGGVLLVPQFTLYADTSKGRRPEFFAAKPPQEAESLFNQFVELFKAAGVKLVQQGSFGAHMHVSLLNDGPVTIIVEM